LITLPLETKTTTFRNWIQVLSRAKILVSRLQDWFRSCDRFKFWEISGNIFEMVQDRDTVTMKDCMAYQMAQYQ